MDKITEILLNVKKIETIKSDDLLKKMLDKYVIFWIDSTSLYLRMKVMYYSFLSIKLGKIDTVVFKNSKETFFAVPLIHGFGYKIVGELEHYWVDKMTTEEAVVITYGDKVRD